MSDCTHECSSCGESCSERTSPQDLRAPLNELSSVKKVIAVMSGHAVQRGGPAAFSKWVRAEAAVRAGADLVLELPAVWASAPAERFAAGAVHILAGTGAVEAVSCGSESGDGAALEQAARGLIEAERDPLLPRLLPLPLGRLR